MLRLERLLQMSGALHRGRHAARTRTARHVVLTFVELLICVSQLIDLLPARTRQYRGKLIDHVQANAHHRSAKLVAGQQIQVEVHGVLQVAQLEHDDGENVQPTEAQPLPVVVRRGRLVETVGEVEHEVDTVGQGEQQEDSGDGQQHEGDMTVPGTDDVSLLIAAHFEIVLGSGQDARMFLRVS